MHWITFDEYSIPIHIGICKRLYEVGTMVNIHGYGSISTLPVEARIMVSYACSCQPYRSFLTPFEESYIPEYIHCITIPVMHASTTTMANFLSIHDGSLMTDMRWHYSPRLQL